LRRKKKESDC